MSTKLICSSNLSLRFYTSDGWTKEELDKYCVKGEVHCTHPQDVDPYFTLTIGSFFDCVRLQAASGGLNRAFNDNPNQTDLQFLEEHNG